jgi:hypothetical protein
MNVDQRRDEIRNRRYNQESFAQIAKDLVGDEKNKPTIWSWAKRNMEQSEIYPRMGKLPQEPYGDFSEAEQWIMFDILSSLFPRLDAMSEHLLTEVKSILTDQHRNFTITAGFLDDLEGRVVETIRQNTAMISSTVSSVIIPRTASSPPPIPGKRAIGGPPPPPPPPGSGLPVQVGVPPGSMAELRTDFEEMSMEEIIALPPDFLEALTPTDRTRVQERVKELKKIEKMAPEERETYFQKKKELKERTDAAEGLGGSLTAMLDDSDSLFARMRRAADDSQVAGTGTFGKFTTEFIYFYCFACGKMNRSEESELSSCEYCDVGAEKLVLDEEKSNYSYWECLSSKNRESVDINYTRGSQIVVRSRWKTSLGEKRDVKDCEPENVREITAAVHVKADPDKQFSHYLTLFRMYSQLNLQGDLKTYICELSDEIQKLPDISTKEGANSQAIAVLDKISFLLEWFESRGVIKENIKSQEIEIQKNNLVQDIKLLMDPESAQELKKASEIGQIAGKTDQILNKFVSILSQLEKNLLHPSRWKCSECNSEFVVMERHQFPEKCTTCGKMITKLIPVSDE